MASAVPGLAPPPGVMPDFTDPYTLQPYQTLTAVASAIMTTVMVVARLYTSHETHRDTSLIPLTVHLGAAFTYWNLQKIHIIKAVKWEDYTCVLGWASFMVFLSVDSSVYKHGGGTHQWDLSNKDVQYIRRYSNYVDMIYSLAVFFTKTSIMLLILRVFCSVQRDVGYWLTQSLIVINGIFYIIYFFIPIFLCFPRSKIWNPEEAGHCLDVDVLYTASSSFNMLSDIAMLSVPIYIIWKLQMSTRRRIGVSAIFLTGGLACIASVLRLVYAVFLARTDDYTYTKAQGDIWTYAEVACGLLCSCLVVLPRLYQHLSSIGGNNTAGVDASRRKLKGHWVHLNGHGLPHGPSEAHKVRRSVSDEEALESAVEG